MSHRKTSGVGTRTTRKDDALVREVRDARAARASEELARGIIRERNERRWGLNDEVNGVDGLTECQGDPFLKACANQVLKRSEW